MLKIVIDANIWIRCLLGGRLAFPVLKAWRAKRFQVVISEPLLAELSEVWQRPRLKKHIAERDARELLDQLRWSAILVEPSTAPPECRDPKDHPFLATAMPTPSSQEMAIYGPTISSVPKWQPMASKSGESNAPRPT